MEQQEKRIVLGVDTALRTTGYGLLEIRGKQFKALDCGTIVNTKQAPYSECVRRIAGGIRQLIEQYKPDIAAIEGGFYLRNAKTAMVLGMVRGSVITTLAQYAVPCYEYAPARAKQAITGYGRASKEQVACVLASMLKLNVSEIPDDATDALSLCVCHALTMHNEGGIHLKDPI